MRILSSANVGGIDFQEIVYPESLCIPRHAHPRAGFCLVLEGAYEESYSSRTLACAARTVTFSPAGHEHVNSFSGQSHCFTIDIPQPWLE